MPPTVNHLGEKRFIRELLSRYASTAGADGQDDCMVIDLTKQSFPDRQSLVVYSVDHPSPIQRPLPEGFKWRFFGRWSAACTCNDVLAMGARPQGFSLDLAIPAETRVDVVTDIYDGLTDVLDEYGTVLQGGNVDINSTLGVVGVSWGTVAPAGMIRRRGARPGDVVAVTTEVGVGWASYVLHKRGLFAKLSSVTRKELESYNLLPLAPHRAIVETVRHLPGAITSGMDMSDGLVEFLYVINETTGCGVSLIEDWLPATPVLLECADLLGVPTSMLGIEFGFDMPRAHVYTVDSALWGAVRESFAAHGAAIHQVGQVTDGGGVMWCPSNGPARSLSKLWDDKCRRNDLIEQWTAMVDRCIG